MLWPSSSEFSAYAEEEEWEEEWEYIKTRQDPHGVDTKITKSFLLISLQYSPGLCFHGEGRRVRI